MRNNLTVEEFYKKTDGSYEQAHAAYPNDEKLSEEIIKFLHDSSFAELQTCIAASDYKGAYNAAEAMCGSCEKLCFTGLCKSAEKIKNKLCETDAFDDIALFTEIRNKYENVVNLLRILEN